MRSLGSVAVTLAVFAFLAAVVASVTSCGESQPEHRAAIEWRPVDAARVRELCGQQYADGCVKRFNNVCTVITEPMPLEQFTGYNHDMTDTRWRALAHEVMHCFGYEHT